MGYCLRIGCWNDAYDDADDGDDDDDDNTKKYAVLLKHVHFESYGTSSALNSTFLRIRNTVHIEV